MRNEARSVYQPGYLCKSKINMDRLIFSMSEQKKIVERYMDGFRATDHEKILSCLTDDVVWEMPGFYLHNGKAAFDREIENPNADGHPDIKVIRLVEEGNIVVAEGTVQAKMKD